MSKNNLFNIPMVRLTVEQMTSQIVAALQDHTGEIEKLIQEEIIKAIKTYDIQREVQIQTEQAIRETIGTAVSELIGYKLKDEIRQTVRNLIKEKLNKQNDI